MMLNFKNAALVLATLLGTSVGFAQTSAPARKEKAPAPAEATTEAKADASASEKVQFEQPLLLTDVGQGNSSKLIEVMVKRDGGVEYKLNNLASAADIGDAKTIVIGVGASTKGLGAAGLDADTEMNRAKALVAAAKEKNIPIIGVHIGGIPRRGELSDGFNGYIMESSDLFIAWKGGNEDGFFSNLSKSSGVPLLLPERKPEVGSVLLDVVHNGFDKSSAEGAAKAQ